MKHLRPFIICLLAFSLLIPTGHSQSKKGAIANAPSAGTTNQYWGPVFQFTAPVLTDYTAVNQGGATATQTGGTVAITAPTNSGASHRMWTKSTPVGAYTVVMAFMAPMIITDNYNYGFVWRQSSDGKLVTLTVAIGGGTAKFEVTKWTNETTFSAAYASFTIIPGYSVIFLKAEDNTTNRISSVSVDGQNWIQIHSVSRTDFLTANQIGVDLNCQSTTLTAAMLWMSWNQT